jgi:hypothetical protein
MSSPKRHECNTSILSSQQNENIARNRHIVKEIIDVLILCGCQNIAIRGEGEGHNEYKSNYMAILRHVSKYNEILQYHLNNTVPNYLIRG